MSGVLLNPFVFGVAGPSYDNPGGMGDRTATITVTPDSGLLAPAGGLPATLVNGIRESENAAYFALATHDGKRLTFDFGSPKRITETTLWIQNATTQGTWKWQGSANGVDWSDLTGSFTLGGATPFVDTSLSANADSYRYYSLLAVSVTIAANPYLYEWEFKLV